MSEADEYGPGGRFDDNGPMTADMRTIYKYHIQVTDEFTLKIPRGAKFLTLQVQRGTPVMWFELTTDTTYFDERTFKVIGTGRTFDTFRVDYRGTFQLAEGDFIGHVYEVV